MSPRVGIREVAAIAAIAIFPACTVPVVRTAPPPSAREVAHERRVQVRVIPVPPEQVFPKIVEVLMDGGFVVRSVNERVGAVSFFQQWVDQNQRGANITVEGSLLCRPAGGGATEIRVILTGSWQTVSYGGGESANAMVGGVERSVDAREYAAVLDLIDRGLRGTK